MQINHAELCAGIGGFSLAARWVGWRNVFHVEIDEWCRSRLEQNFPESENYGDIKKFSGKKYKGQIHVLSGGFPCQPYSVAGNRHGKNDDRYQWPSMFRVLKEIQPRFVVFENVPNLLNMGLDSMLDDLECEGYTCWPPFIIPSGAVGADHLRERLWVVAHASGKRQKTLLQGKESYSVKKKPRKAASAYHSPIIVREQFEKSCSESLLLSSKDGLPKELDGMQTIKAMGNALSPHIAYEIYKQIDNLLN